MHKPQATRITTTPAESFPRKHMLAVGVILVTVALGTLLLPSDDVEAERINQSVAISFNTDTKATETEPTPPSLPAIEWHEFKVGNGDTLSDIFNRAGLSATDMMNIVNSGPLGKSLTRIYPGQSISFARDASGQLTDLRHHLSKLETTHFVLNEEGINAEKIVLTPDVYVQYKTATIDSSLFLAGQKAGLSQNQIMEIAGVFSGVIDFVLDPRKGDTFSVLYEELFLEGEKIGDGDIIAAQYNGDDGEYTAYRYTDQNGNIGYYTPEGVSMRKAFLRAPLDFTRISSSFNMRRKHPIHNKIKAHRGIDYAAPRGTPIYAAGDGRVVKAGYSKANGNYVFIQHGEQYVTKYLHLHKRSVKQGDRVRQKQIIGSVGSTGYATGPHLHYEFLVNGVHRNPRTIVDKLPKAKSIDKREMARFSEATRPIAQQFASFQQRFALRDTNPDQGN
jgi:murein DD-endopeptidase MepM/ murein hydrolase activator NlpD